MKSLSLIVSLGLFSSAASVGASERSSFTPFNPQNHGSAELCQAEFDTCQETAQTPLDLSACQAQLDACVGA